VKLRKPYSVLSVFIFSFGEMGLGMDTVSYATISAYYVEQQPSKCLHNMEILGELYTSLYHFLYVCQT
jgi:hypothetical protein